MALQPSLRPLIVAGIPDAPHTLDIFLDYVCPYSAKMALVIENILKPWMGRDGPYGGKIKLIFRLQLLQYASVQGTHAQYADVRAYHPQVLRASPENFWSYTLALFKNQADYFDIPTANLTPIQIREQLIALAAQIIPLNAVEEVRELLKLKGSANGGVAITDDLKYNIKFARQNSIHVSPTVLWDGLVAAEVSSSWGAEEWEKFLRNKVIV